MGALDQLRAANGDNGISERIRSNPRWAIALVVAAVLLIAWIAWAIYVTSSNGATAGLGVLLAWPALLAALVLISLPFIGGYLLVRRLSDGDPSETEADASGEDEDVEEDEEDGAAEEDSDEGGTEEEGSEEEEGEEAEAEKASD